MFNVLDLSRCKHQRSKPDFIRKLPNMQAAEFTIESVAKPEPTRTSTHRLVGLRPVDLATATTGCSRINGYRAGTSITKRGFLMEQRAADHR